MPLPELSVVRLRADTTGDRGRLVPVGAVGTIVHVHTTSPGASPAYIVEVVIADATGSQIDAHLFDATDEELEST